MKNPVRFHTVLLFSVILISLGFACPANAAKSVNEKCPVSATAKVIIENVSGSIEVAGWNNNEVTVTGMMDDKVERLDFGCDNNRVRVKVILPERKNKAGAADLKITVPAGSSVDVRTVTAGIRVDGVRGALSLDSVTGDIKATGQPDSVEVKSVTGDVAILAVTQTVEAQSVSSNINLKGIRSRVKASTTSGDIEVGDANVSDGSFHSVSGDIRFDGSLSSGARLKIESLSGRIEATLPRSISAEFNVSTFSGEISNDFGQTPQKTSRYGPGEKLIFSTGSDARISLESFSGPVFLKRK
jgi:DUF4097 and DUF4098 domain-containing protein YvlB